MIKGWFLLPLLVTLVGPFAASSAFGQSAGSYGYQCYSTLDGVQHCSCQNFTDSDSGYAWMFQQLDALRANTDGPVMASHSDVASQVQAAPCDN